MASILHPGPASRRLDRRPRHTPRARRRGPDLAPLVAVGMVVASAAWLVAMDVAGDQQRARSSTPVVRAATPARAVVEPSPPPLVRRDRVAIVPALARVDRPRPDRAMPAVAAPPESAVAAATASGVAEVPPIPDHVTIAVAGDILPHERVNDRAAARAGDDGGWDFAPLLAPTAPLVSAADLALCHLEVPIAPAGEAVTAYPAFGAPAPLVDAIAETGWDGCSLASNHSLDRGVAGVEQTLEEFDRVGLVPAGLARSAAERGAVRYHHVDGVRVAHLSYAYGFNGHRVPADRPWLVQAIDPVVVERDARRASAHADLVVVSLHWGTEGVHAPTAAQREVLDALLPSEHVDLVVGHHAHVVQPMERVEGTWVLWGLGNHLSNQRRNEQRDGVMAMVRAEPAGAGEWEVVGVTAVPTWVDVETHRVLPAVAGDIAAGEDRGVRRELAASHARTAAVLQDGEGTGLSIAQPPCVEDCG